MANWGEGERKEKKGRKEGRKEKKGGWELKGGKKLTCPVFEPLISA